jgi:leucyl aminopeptidase
MKISFDAKTAKAQAMVIFAEEGGKLFPSGKALDKKTKGAIGRAMKAENFQGKAGQVVVATAPSGVSYSHVAVLGLGKKDFSAATCEKMGGNIVACLNARKVTNAVVDFSFGLGLESESLVALGAVLSSYRFDKYRTKEPKDKKPTLKSLSFVVADAAAARKSFADLRKTADAVFLARDLISEAPNVLYPESFANIIKAELSPLGIEVNILSRKDMEKLGMGSLLAVAQGSDREGKLVTMHYKGGTKNQRNIAFVGKGVTFDTGGISIKPAASMDEMKFDMAGAAAVVGAMKSLASRGVAANVVGVVGLVENMPSGNAYRPGDILTSMSGQTIEVLNTDAEGRLVLADALWYCQEKFNPTHIVDLATLTGAVIIALGHEYAAVFCNDNDFSEELVTAGLAVGEELWPMPLNDAWDKAIDSPVADMKNIGGGRDAGSATAAHFLKRFIKNGVKWAHLDIAGVAWAYKDRISVPKGAAAFGVRLLDRYVNDIISK